MFDNIMTAVQQSQNGGTSTFEFIWWVASVVGMWKMFEKAGEPGWPALIPFYNYYKLCDICMKNPWYWLRMFVVVIPVFGWIAYLYFAYQMYKAVAVSYGKPEVYAWGLIFLSPVFFCMFGFGEADYYGPNGVGDRRTSQARGAKTVNFDVIKNDSQPQQKQTRVEPAKPEEDTVDFNFDQPEE